MKPHETPAPYRPKFVEGSTLRHVIMMTLTGSIGLMAIFFVDLLSLLYVSWLKKETLTAGVGYAATVLFFATSVNVGLMIATGALVSRALGAGDRTHARKLAASCVVLQAVVAGFVTLALLPFLRPLLETIGATGEALEVALHFLWITMPSNVLMALGMGMSGVLRAVGDARRSMNVTLIGGIATAILDPILIFGLGFGVYGAAIATVISRLVFVIVGANGVVWVHDLMARPRLRDVVADARPMFDIAMPAVLTNVATPVANAFVLKSLAQFGDAIVAGNTILDRIIPVAFGALFALSGAVGPIFGQNFGARRFDRVRQTLRDALLFALVYVLVLSLILFLARHQIPHFFGAVGATAEYVTFFCLIGGVMWIFNGALFVANAAFNNLGFPLLSTAFNWGRATLGTIPFAIAGAAYGGPFGVLVGVTLGSMIFGIAAMVTALRQVRLMESRASAVSPIARAAGTA
jgi:putative MATE family efflux protein